MDSRLREHSHVIIDGPSRAPARSYFRAVGFSDADLQKPIVGIANTWIETMPCNSHLRLLAEKVKEGVRAAGGTPMEFNTIAISDGETMGTDGMKASLVSREVIADSIELVGRGYMFDAMVALAGCDKTIPATAMGLTRLNLPSLVLYGGSIQPGRFHGHDVTIQDVFEAVGAHSAGKMSDADLKEIESVACPGAGACGGQFTANTMAMALEFIGLTPMGLGNVPATDPRKGEAAYRSGTLVMDLLRKGITPRQILTRKAFENAISAVVATGGSTNAVLHLLAMAKEAEIELRIEEFDEISSRTPLLADMKPWGRFTAVDLYNAGGMALAGQAASGRGAPAPRADDSQPENIGRRGAHGQGIAGTGSRAPAVESPEEHRRPDDPERQSGPRRLRAENLRPRKAALPGTSARFRSRRRRHGRRGEGPDQERRRRCGPL